MVELTQIIADSMYNFFIVVETLLTEADNIIIFDNSLYTWLIVFMIGNWFINLLLDLLYIETENFVDSEEVFND
jgi:hypothetical protein